MNQGYIEINGVRTKVVTWGRWIEQSSDKIEDIILIIPGNPGVVGFYDLFAKTIHEKLGYPVWCIGHSGHNIPKDRIIIPTLKEYEELYGLKGQIQHKIDFCEKYIPKNARLHLIGHSIGSYMILEILDHPSVKENLCDAFLLFPTVEHMAKTKNGIFLNRYIKPIIWLIVFLSWIFCMLPRIMQTILLYVYMILTGMPIEVHLENVRSLIKPTILKRVFFLAYQELDQVKERNNDVIKRNINKIKFYYGMNDGWAPGKFCDRIKNDIANVDAQVSDYNHEFVINRSIEIGQLVSNWIKAKL